MSQPVVIVRDYRGRPARLVVVSRAPDRVYVTGQDTIDAVARGELSAVGFPFKDVFQFDEEAYRRLAAEWDSEGCVEPCRWDDLRPLSAEPLPA